MAFTHSNDPIEKSTSDTKISKIEDPGSIAYDNYLYASSVTEMTGLTPSIAHNEHEAQNYEEVYPYLPPASHPADGIRAEYRTEVTPQSHSKKKNPHSFL